MAAAFAGIAREVRAAENPIVDNGSDHCQITTIVTTVGTSGDDVMDKVDQLLREVSAEVIEPRFESLRSGDVRYKSPGELVTIADEEAEGLLKVRLSELIPDALVVGEEEFSGSSHLQEVLKHDRVWLVDPLDGTANFVAGSPQWAVMVALLERDETSAAWIWQPAVDAMYRAQLGAGSDRNGIPNSRLPASSEMSDLRGAVLTRFLDATLLERVAANRHRFRSVGPGTTSAGIDYPRLADGQQDFVMFWRTLPWDHAPGALIVTESGGCVRRLNGDEYSPRQTGAGLLAVSEHSEWEPIADALLRAP